MSAERADPERSARNRLKVTFETAADRYHEARPDYPAELYDTLIAAADLRYGARLLEVGPGTGKATLPLAERGFQITALELGPRLAEAARRRLAGYERVEIIQTPFETWEAPHNERFELVFSATAWHWIDPAVGYELAWRRLRPGGHLAVWTAQHVLPDDGDPFFQEIQDVYEEIGESLPSDRYWPQPGSLPTDEAAIAGSGLFSPVLVKEFIWASSYTAEQYVALLDTFSSHIDMAQWQRDRLYGAIRQRLAARPGGMLRRHWGAVLQVASRRDQRTPSPFPAD